MFSVGISPILPRSIEENNAGSNCLVRPGLADAAGRIGRRHSYREDSVQGQNNVYLNGITPGAEVGN